MKNSAALRLSLVSYFFLLLLYSIFSYCLVHPNLVLLSWEPYWNFQTWIWHTFFDNRMLLGQTYTFLICAIFANFFFILHQLSRHSEIITHGTSILQQIKKLKPYIIVGLLVISPIFLSYNMLSSDMFNYIFNAKMVVVYQTNPHLFQAERFHDDPWIRFMSNTYGLAPYGYGWTALSILPYVLGGNRFLLTWLIFRGFSVLSLFLLFVTYLFFANKKSAASPKSTSFRLLDFAVIFLNPLVLIEIVTNAHNDMWMMWSALLSFGVLIFANRKNLWWRIILSIVLMGFSVSMKFVTELLLPVWAGICIWTFVNIFQVKLFTRFQKLGQFLFNLWPLYAAIILFIPLLTERSRQFYPWYLTWVLTWIPFIKGKYIRNSVLFLSFTAMLRYIPWLLTDSYGEVIELQQKMIIWIPFLTFAVLYGGFLGISFYLRKQNMLR